MLALSVAPEVPTTQGHTESAQTVVASGHEEGQAEAAKPSADAGPQRTLVGEYRNLAEHREGRIRLEVQGNAVYAALQTVRSPVQYFARQQPEVLFTIPEGFRPAIPITWEVNGQHVGANGQLDPGRRDLQVFRLRVDTEGRVRYVDDRGVDDVGYLRYRTALAWPLAGTDPLVCERNSRIQRRILAALADAGEGVLSCSQVGWEHLARIRTWSSQEPPTIQHYYQRPAVWHWMPEPASQEASNGQYYYRNRYFWPPFPYWKKDLPLPREYAYIRSHDLLGLTNLTELHVNFGSQSPSDPMLLAHTPRLLALSMAGPYLPRDFLVHTPLLSHLHLGGFSDDRLLDETADALVQVPHLTSLDLGFRHPTDKVSNLFQHVPQLTRLTIDGLTEPLPEDFLSVLSRLTHLTVEGEFNPCAIPPLHLSTNLTDFALRLVVDGSQVACLTDSWLLHASTLTELSIDLHGLENLETDTLPHMPALTRLTLDVGDVTVLPDRLLSNLSSLTHLQLHQGPNGHSVDAALDLPPELLAGSPELIELSLDLPSRLNHVPADLLAPVPNLKRLRLDGPRLATLPSGLLDNQHHVTDVNMELCDLDRLPEDFLAYTPQLRSLYIGRHSYRCYRGLDRPGPISLPERFLSHTPNLTHLWLGFPGLLELPPSFLAHVPRLQHLELEYTYGKHGKFTYALRSVPDHFLDDAPNLTYLNLWPVVALSDLPADFLARSSRLQFLYLDANGVSILPDSFLTQVSQLRSAELDLQQVNALPDGFLGYTPGLAYLKLDVDRVKALPGSFLAHAPYLGQLYTRAANVVALPEDFLAHSSRIDTLGLGMPRLESPPGPGDRLWDMLESASIRVKLTDPDFQVSIYDESECLPFIPQFELGDILEVAWRELDDEENAILWVYPWWQRSVFFSFYERHECPFAIAARYTEPTLDT